MVVKNLDPLARASATSVSFQQKTQSEAAVARPEKIVVIGNYQDGKDVENLKLTLASGNPDDAGVRYGFGSPLHRMAKKLFPASRDGSKVETYYLPVAKPGTSAKHKIKVDVDGLPKSNFNGYLMFKEYPFEAAADVAGKVATNAQLNPAKAPRGIDLDIFNKKTVPFTILKGMTQSDIFKEIKNIIDDNVELPFIATEVETGTAESAKISGTSTVDVTSLTATDYKITIQIDSNETQTIDIGSISATTAVDVIDAVNAELTGATLSATTSTAATTTFHVESDTTGETSNIIISTPSTGTDLMAALNVTGEASGSTNKHLELESKFAGSTAKFEIGFIDKQNETISVNRYGITFKQEVLAQCAGVVNITDALEVITEEKGITRVVSQFSDDASLDAMQAYFEGLRDGLSAQYVLCYSAQAYSEDSVVKGTVDVNSLIAKGNERREDAVNVLIAGDYGDLRTLKWKTRDTLLKAGISNLEPKVTGGYKIGDLCTFFHPIGIENPLYKFDRNVCLIGNMAYDQMQTFKYGEAWQSIVIVGDKDFTNNPAAVKVKDIVAAMYTRIDLYAKAGWVANAEEVKKDVVVEKDSSNPDRVNINLPPELSSVGRIFDITNKVGFNLN